MQTNSSNFRDFTRGGQTTLHFIRMFWQVLRQGLNWSLCVLLIIFGCNIYSKTTKYDFYLMNEYFDGNLEVLFHGERANHTVKNNDGTVSRMRAVDFVNRPAMQRYLNKWGLVVNTSTKNSIISAIGFLFAYLAFCVWKGKRQSATQNINGQGQVEPKQLKRLLKQNRKASSFTLAGVPLVNGSETQHILLAGTTGAGKTAAMRELMDQARAKGQRAVVYDIDGSFIPAYYRHGKDILLNPLDERAPAWNIWQECADLADFDTAALSLMPEHLAMNDPFWIRSAHTIFACAALRLRDKKPTTKLLLDSILGEGLEPLADLLKGTPAAPLVSSKIEKTALSIQATLSTHCKSLIYLRDEGQNPLFSIRDWIEKGKDDSWLFIAANEKKVEALRPLLSVWLDVAAKSILSLEHAQALRLWFFIDELPSLHKLPSITTALSRGRKYGAAFVAAIQDVHQLHSIYGRNDAGSLTSLFNTKVFYRTQEPDSAAWMSRNMGEMEILEKREGFTYGAHEMRDGVSINHERRTQPVIRPSEFSELEDLNAYLKLAGNWPVAKLKFSFKPPQNLCKSFVPRDLTELLLLEKKVDEKINALNQSISKLEVPKPDDINEHEAAVKSNANIVQTQVREW